MSSVKLGSASLTEGPGRQAVRSGLTPHYGVEHDTAIAISANMINARFRLMALS